MNDTKENGRIFYDWWQSVSLKRKFGLFTWMVTFAIGLAVVINLFAVNFAISGFGRILDDNSRCYSFQQAMEEERTAFNAYVRNRTEEKQQEYEAACAAAVECLERLPFNYPEIGSARYAQTWSIRNAYGAYCVRRDQVAGMQVGEMSYVKALYEVYGMQDYLEGYARQLIQLTLEDGNRQYVARIPVLNFLPNALFLMGLVMILVISGLSGLIRRSIMRPIDALARVSRRIAQNDFSDTDVEVENKDEMGELVTAFNRMKHATKGYIHALQEKHEITERLHKEELERVEMEKILEATRLEVLKSQVNPHFLFNTLNTIACMAQLEEASTTESMITSMSNLFRYNLKTTETEVLLARELKIVEDYLYIQQIRFGERLSYRRQVLVDENKVVIPALSLQPIVENAVIHGVSKKEQGGKIHIRIERKGEYIVLSVADSGVGMSREQLMMLREACRGRNTSKIGIGLGNIYKRLQMMYQGAELKILSKEGMGTMIQMWIPEKKEREYVSGTDCG